MSVLNEKIAYIKGLADGVDYDKETKEGRIITEIIGMLEAVAFELTEVVEQQDEILDAIYTLEDDVDSILDDECDCCGFDGDIGPLTVKCPDCGEIVEFTADDIDDDDFLECPFCGEDIEIEFDEDDFDAGDFRFPDEDE